MEHGFSNPRVAGSSPAAPTSDTTPSKSSTSVATHGKHTPGPWEVAQYENYSGYSIWAKDAGCIAERWYPSETTEIPIEANARLIAAAPQLLEFGQQVIEAFFEEYEYEDKAPNNPTIAAIRRLQAVIRHAKGQQ